MKNGNQLFAGLSDMDVAKRIDRLRLQNVAMGVLHLLQAIVIWVLNETKFKLPITATYPTDAPGLAPPRLWDPALFQLDIGGAIFLFLALSALAHFVIASPLYFPRYKADLKRGKNTARWVEYSVSASIMLVVIASITGIIDVAALIAIVGANAAMIFFGDMQERYEKPGGSLIPFWLGTVVGIIPWIAIGFYLFGVGAEGYDLSEVPGFVWVIFFALFAFFFSFGLNQWLQFKRIGRWANYLTGETTYVVLSLVAKSLLAWLLFANVLVLPTVS
ncbi:MAG: heliorhodopsin HeR [Nitriliruptoraceae bacterium]